MADRESKSGPISRRQALGALGAAVSAGAVASVARPAKAQQWGRVFVFNMASDKVELELNRRALPAIVGTAREDYYIPDVISVDRSTLPGNLVVGEFAARNKLIVRYAGDAVVYEISVDAAKYELGQDLQLYVHRDGLVLLHKGADVSDGVRKIS